jgi:rubrerythrin
MKSKDELIADSDLQPWDYKLHFYVKKQAMKKMKSKDRLIGLIKKQIGIEKQVGKSVEKQLEMVHTAAARLLLMEMKYDAKKHASILQGILDVIAGSDVPLWDYRIGSYVDKLVVKKELDKHIEIEKFTLDMAKQEIRHTDDDGIKLLLQHIVEDEDRHHALLRTIVNKSYKINP